MTETQQCIQRLVGYDPTPVAVARGVVENLADNLGLLLAGSKEPRHQAWIEYLRAVLETEPDDHEVVGENMVELFPNKNRQQA